MSLFQPSSFLIPSLPAPLTPRHHPPCHPTFLPHFLQFSLPSSRSSFSSPLFSHLVSPRSPLIFYRDSFSSPLFLPSHLLTCSLTHFLSCSLLISSCSLVSSPHALPPFSSPHALPSHLLMLSFLISSRSPVSWHEMSCDARGNGAAGHESHCVLCRCLCPMRLTGQGGNPGGDGAAGHQHSHGEHHHPPSSTPAPPCSPLLTRPRGDTTTSRGERACEGGCSGGVGRGWYGGAGPHGGWACGGGGGGERGSVGHTGKDGEQENWLKSSPLATEEHVTEALRLFHVATLKAARSGVVDGAVLREEQRREVQQVEGAVRRHVAIGGFVSDRRGGCMMISRGRGISESTVSVGRAGAVRAAADEEVEEELMIIEESAMERMEKTLDSVRGNFNTVRTGRASPSLLDRIEVEYYGTNVILKSIAQIATPDASMLLVTPFDKSSIPSIEKAIMKSDVGLTPSSDGNVIRLSIPQLTAERRKELLKTVSKLSEDGKVALRNVRRDSIKAYEKLQKDKKISEDALKDLSNDIQKMTDDYVKQIETAFKQKEKDLLTV
ncbi:unnamed protein product [Closterium sp. Naga37s-1]|nr:unnamed protein product [Closterium sp. Naga37s-1]